MSIIFLDIDGVLNSSRSCLAKVGTPPSGLVIPQNKSTWTINHTISTIDPVAVALVNKVIAQCASPVLVLSSSHRLLFTDEVSFGSAEHLSKLAEYMELLGIKGFSEFSVTPHLADFRGKEVDCWMQERFDTVEMPTYVILDDAKEFLGHQPFVHVDSHVGFSYHNYLSACEHLKISASPIT